MTTKDLRTLINNLDEYIHVPGGIERLKKTVLHLAVSGQLVPQNPSEGTGEELYFQIQTEKQKTNTIGKGKSFSQPEITKNDIPFDTPKGWKWVRLGSIIELKSGADLVPSKYNDTQNGIPYITGASSIQNEQVIINRWTTEPKNIAEKNDLLITCKGTIGAMAFLGVEKVHIARQLMAVRFNQFLSPQFIKLVITTNVTALQEAAQSIIPGIARSDMLGILIALPPLEEQRRIVEKVDMIFALIDELTARYEVEQAERQKFVASSLATLSRGDSELALSHLFDIIRTRSDAARLRKATLRLALSGQLTSQDSSEGTGEDFYRELQAKKQALVLNGGPKKHSELPPVSDDEAPFSIPRGWKWVRLGSLFTFINGDRGKNYPSKDKLLQSGDIPFFSAVNLENNRISSEKLLFLSREQFDVLGSGKVQINDLIVCIRGSLGKHAISNYSTGAIASSLVILRNSASTDTLTAYLAEYLDSDLFSSEISKYDNGTAQPNLSAENLKKFLVPLPPLQEQARIVARTAQLFALVSEFESILEAPRAIVNQEVERAQQPVVKQGEAAINTYETLELSKQQKKVQRKMLASFIANESLDGKQFGKTKFEKLLHLIEYHVLKKDLNQKYSVQPAGPYDGGFTRLFWDDVVKSKWFKVEGHGNLQKIVAGDKHDRSQKDYGYLSDNEKNKIRGVITLVKDWGYGEAEIISTLYAVWNNRLIKGEEISDDLLKQDFLQWDSQKTQYSNRLDPALVWMRQNGIVPDGWGNEIKRAKKSVKVVR